MLREILKYPDPFLKTKAETVEEVDEDIRTLINDMVETMYAGKGVGLAAVQVGVAKRVVVLDVAESEDDEPGSKLIAIVNPEIIETEGQTTFEEGCLSFPGLTADVKRSERVRVRGLNRDGKEIVIDTGGIFAIALQHEVDHLDGLLFIDRLSRLRRDMLKRRYKKLVQEAEREAV